MHSFRCIVGSRWAAGYIHKQYTHQFMEKLFENDTAVIRSYKVGEGHDRYLFILFTPKSSFTFTNGVILVLL